MDISFWVICLPFKENTTGTFPSSAKSNLTVQPIKSPLWAMASTKIFWKIYIDWTVSKGNNYWYKFYASYEYLQHYFVLFSFPKANVWLSLTDWQIGHLHAYSWLTMDGLIMSFCKYLYGENFWGEGGGYSLTSKANGDVPLDGVAFSRLEWLYWGRIFNRFTRMGSQIFGFLG